MLFKLCLSLSGPFTLQPGGYCFGRQVNFAPSFDAKSKTSHDESSTFYDQSNITRPLCLILTPQALWLNLPRTFGQPVDIVYAYEPPAAEAELSSDITEEEAEEEEMAEDTRPENTTTWST